jgi:hypothetical protein
MPRGQSSPLGSRTVNQNGYAQIKTEDGWVPEHVINMEKHLGRKLGKGEKVRFKDGDRSNTSIENLELTLTNYGTTAKRIAQLRAKLEDIQAELRYHEEILAKAAEAAKATE